MENNKIVKMAAILIIAPIVIGAVVGIINLGIMGVNGIKTANYNRKIKKGLKDGSIVEIDGKYYEFDTKGFVDENIKGTNEEA